MCAGVRCGVSLPRCTVYTLVQLACGLPSCAPFEPDVRIDRGEYDVAD